MKSRWVLLYFDEPIEPAPPGTTMHRVYLAGEADEEMARLKVAIARAERDELSRKKQVREMVLEIGRIQILADELVAAMRENVTPRVIADWAKIECAEIDREGA